MKKALCLLLSLLLLFSVSIAVSASYDDDISGQWDADPAPLSGLSVERDAAFFTVYNADNKTAGITAVIACYDENGRIISVKSSREAALSVNSLSSPVPEGTAYVKSF
ncbi:MAG: hypothetical protein IJS65_07455, partial [Clostridia bacterium]|nr:hypothetical protein [Clostridia bacterium]